LTVLQREHPLYSGIFAGIIHIRASTKKHSKYQTYFQFYTHFLSWQNVQIPYRSTESALLWE